MNTIKEKLCQYCHEIISRRFVTLSDGRPEWGVCEKPSCQRKDKAQVRAKGEG